jgi:hypothetical protein
MGIRPNPSVHKWYYKFAQTADEVLVFKQFDNLAMPGRAHIQPSLIPSMRMQIPERALKLGQSLYGLSMTLLS